MKNNNNNNNNTWNYVFALTAFAIAGLLAFYPSSDDFSNDDFPLTEQELTEENRTLEKKSKKTVTAKKEVEVMPIQKSETSNTLEEEQQTIHNKTENEVFVNKIVVAKNVDTDNTSNTFRDFIKDEYQTITTNIPGVVKNINYYPSFFVWASVNTEKVNLKNINNQIEPVNLSLVISSDKQELERVDYEVTSATPRWREWIEIDLSLLEEKMIKGTWEVQIINNENKEILESRNFKLITPEINKQEQTAELKKVF